MRALVRGLAGLALVLTVVTLIPTAGFSQKLIEPHQPGWERWFKLDWESGDLRGRPVVKGYLYNDSGKLVRDVQLLVDALDATGGVLAQKVSWLNGGDMEAFSRRYFVAEAPLVAVAPQQPAAYRVRVYSFNEIQGGPQR